MTKSEIDRAEENILQIIQMLQLQYEKSIEPWLKKLEMIHQLKPRDYKNEAYQYAMLRDMGILAKK